MKCNVCGSKVPRGVQECPVCGGKVESKINQTMKTGYQQKSFQYKNHNKKALLLCGAAFLAILVYVFVAQEKIPDRFRLEDISRLTYQETVDKGYDNGSVPMAIEVQNEVEKFLEDEISIKDIAANRYCLTDGHTVTAIFHVSFIYENIEYSLGGSIKDKQMSNYSIDVSGETKESMQNLAALPIDQTIMNTMGEYIKVSDAYSLLNETRLKLKQDKDVPEQSSYSNGDHPKVFMQQTKESETKYYFSGRLDNEVLKK